MLGTSLVTGLDLIRLTVKAQVSAYVCALTLHVGRLCMHYACMPSGSFSEVRCSWVLKDCARVMSKAHSVMGLPDTKKNIQPGSYHYQGGWHRVTQEKPVKSRGNACCMRCCMQSGQEELPLTSPRDPYVKNAVVHRESP